MGMILTVNINIKNTTKQTPRRKQTDTYLLCLKEDKMGDFLMLFGNCFHKKGSKNLKHRLACATVLTLKKVSSFPKIVDDCIKLQNWELVKGTHATRIVGMGEIFNYVMVVNMFTSQNAKL